MSNKLRTLQSTIRIAIIVIAIAIAIAIATATTSLVHVIVFGFLSPLLVFIAAWPSLSHLLRRICSVASSSFVSFVVPIRGSGFLLLGYLVWLRGLHT
jgi:large-conductance mechanosensitive channel